MRLTLRVPSSAPIEVFGITPAAVAGLSELEVARLPVRHGNRVEPLGEFFDVSRRKMIGVDIQFAGDTSNVHGIAADMTDGFVYVENEAGRHAGARMSGGLLVADMGAGDWLGAEMSGGEIEVRGAVGDQAGAAYRGSRRGMRGGSIHVLGAGDELGLLMRRGVITVDGPVGRFAGASMIAGTLILNGEIGERLGAGMKRGTIVVREGPPLPPGFAFACEYRPTFLPLLVKGERQVRCWRGDMTTGGRGEVLQVLGEPGA